MLPPTNFLTRRGLHALSPHPRLPPSPSIQLVHITLARVYTDGRAMCRAWSTTTVQPEPIFVLQLTPRLAADQGKKSEVCVSVSVTTHHTTPHPTRWQSTYPDIKSDDSHGSV
jgi:hypothetical protein